MKNIWLPFAIALFVKIFIGLGLFFTILIVNNHVYELTAKVDRLNIQIHDLTHQEKNQKEIYEDTPSFNPLSILPFK